jgi:hypothetical protein
MHQWAEVAGHTPFKAILEFSVSEGEAVGLSPMQSAGLLNLFFAICAVIGIFLAARAARLSFYLAVFSAALFGAFASTQYFATESDCYVMVSALTALSLWLAGRFVRAPSTRNGIATIFIMLLGCYTHRLFFAVPAAVALSWLAAPFLDRKLELTRRQGVVWAFGIWAGLAAILLLFAGQWITDYQGYQASGWGVRLFSKDGLLLTLAAIAAPVDILIRGNPGIGSWNVLGWFLIVPTMSLALVGAIGLFSQKCPSRGLRIAPVALLVVWLPFLTHWSSEYHFYSLLMPPLALLAGLGAQHLPRAKPVRISAALFVALLFAYNAAMVTVPKNNVENSAFIECYQLALEQKATRAMVVTEADQQPHQLAFLLTENFGIQAHSCRYDPETFEIEQDFPYDTTCPGPVSGDLLFVQAANEEILEQMLRKPLPKAPVFLAKLTVRAYNDSPCWAFRVP